MVQCSSTVTLLVMSRHRPGDNLQDQLVKLFPHCQFLVFVYEEPIKLPYFVRHDDVLVNQHLLDDRNIGGIVVTNCTLDEIKSRENETLTFAIDDSRMKDLKRLNMSHCFEG